jgi:uncharacterized protein (DUF1501 family)
MNHTVSTRREFLQRGLVVLSASVTVPTFLDRTVLAIARPDDAALLQQPSGADGKILVIVQLSGGNDGLNTVIPHGDDKYHRARPALHLDAKTVLKIDNYLGLHPNLAPVKALYDEGQMSIVQGVGYPNPNRSHFRSMDIWHSAEPEKELTTNGWLGRYFDNACPGCDPHVGVSIGETLPLAMKGDRILPLSFERPESYRYNGRDKESYAKLNAAPATPSPENQLDFLTRTAMDAQMSSDQILTATRNHQPPQQYPGGEFGAGLRTVAAMIAGGLPTRVYYVSLGGFDTHAQQKNRHDQLMNQFAQGVSAFWADMKQQKNEQRVLMMTFSEFGRRVEQNASAGTDHGAAAPMFLFGPNVRPGVLGKHPSLSDLDQGDLKYGVDFRNVYASVLQNWLEAPSKPILGAQFKPVNVIKA